MLKLKVKLFDSRAKLPEVAHAGEDFGFDVFACIPEDSYEMVPVGPGEAKCKYEKAVICIEPGDQKMIPVGFAAEVSDFEVMGVQLGVFGLSPKPVHIKAGLIAKQPSGLALKRRLDVKAGVIDAGYRNEIKILLYNYGKEKQYIRHHDKVAQLVPIPVFTGEVEQVQELSEAKRGLAGWGSGQKEVKVTGDEGRPKKPIDPSPTPWDHSTWGFYCDTCGVFFSLLNEGRVVPNDDCTHGYEHNPCKQPARYIGYDHSKSGGPFVWNNQGRYLCDYCNEIAEHAKCNIDQPVGFASPELIPLPKGKNPYCESCKTSLLK